VQKALEQLMQGRSEGEQRTTIIIAHRLSTIQRADRIAVLQEGKLVEVGKHAELLSKNGLYAHLYHLQFDPQRHAV
jgi:subfamily B ATP-binding cassette protein MsbA